MKPEKDILRIKRNIKRLGEEALIDFFYRLKEKEGGEIIDIEEDEVDGWIILNSVVSDLKKGKSLDYILTDQEERDRGNSEKAPPKPDFIYGTIFEVKKKKHPMGKPGEWYWIEFGYNAGDCCGDACEFWVQKIDGKLVVDDDIPRVITVF